MPISEKIMEEIKKLNEDEKKKELLLKILQQEDEGIHNYKKSYEKLINQYIADVDDNDFYIMLNSSCQDKTVKIPAAIGGKKWYRVVDTSLPSPEDFLPAGEEEMLNRSVYVLPARSMAVLLSK